MIKHLSPDPSAMVLAQSVMAFTKGFPTGTEELGRSILYNRGLGQLEVDKFYPLQSMLDAMDDLAEKFSADVLYLVGINISVTAKLPPGMTDMNSVLTHLHEAFMANHQGSNLGGWEYLYDGLNQGMHRGRVIGTTPYPCAFDRGVLESFGRLYQES